MLRNDFLDSRAWDEMANKLPYRQPDWHESCSREAMLWLLECFDLTEKGYIRLTKTTLDEFMSLNPDWPLRAFVGLLLEHHEEKYKHRTA